jgi:twitching motility protein PilT
MQTFDQHLLQHLEAGRITMDEAVHMATSPHDFKLMVAAGGKPKGEGQAQHPGAVVKKTIEPDESGMSGVATVEPPEPAALPEPGAPAGATAPPPPVATPSAAPPSAPPPGF